MNLIELTKFDVVFNQQNELTWPQEGARETAPDAPANAARESLDGGTRHTTTNSHQGIHGCMVGFSVRMILPQVHLRKPCYDFSFL